ncbi:TonB-dependent receptor [Citromicrobium bathyomarinum]|uniref:TonB-dependent receptor n=1 Tax=Citromicrobium bathyomarinum TaxID=72174 RepID=UPI00315A5B50
MRIVWILLAAFVALLSTPAAAERVAVQSPAGTLSDAAIVLARQTRTSIVITDPALARRHVKALRGQMETDDAIRRLARMADARAVSVGPSAWRIEAGEKRPRKAAQPRTRKPPPAVAPSEAAPPPPPPPPVEILVVASKRSARLEEFAGQVSMLDGDDLEFGGIGGTEKIAEQVATVSSTYLGSGRNKLFIRGIADSSFTGPTQATVGQYLGDLRLSYNSPDPDLRLSDLSRVEVLEGPQGTLYGAGSLGGIIRLVPNEPELGLFDASGMVGGSVTQHGQPGADLNAMLNMPLAGDSAALRLVVDAATQGGYIDKPLLGRNDVNRTDILGGRAIARLEFAPGWTADLIALGQSTRAADSQYADRFGPPLTRAARVREGAEADYRQGQFIISGAFGAVQFRTSTGIAWHDLEERYDATAPDGAPRLFTQRNDTRMIANETRLWQPLGSRFGWLAGISLTENRTQLNRSLETDELSASATGVLNEVSEFTLYGEANARLFDGLIATAGARYTRSQLGGAGEDVPLAVAIAGREITASRDETAFLPSFSLLAEVLPETSLYLRYQEGFRPGGLAIEGNFVRRFRNDRAATFEFGLRHGRPGRGPFDLTASIAHTRWRDIQADFIDAFGLPSTANIGDGRVWTASISGSVELAPALRVNGGFTYNDSAIDQPDAAFLTRTMQVPNIARYAGRAGVDYRRTISGNLELTAKGWASYIGKSRLGLGPELGELQGDYFDSGLVVRVGRDSLGISLGITNIADVEGNRFALGTPFAVGREHITPLQPRTIRLGIDASF